MQDAATEGGEIKCMVLTAENNARVMMGCITDCIAAVNILTNMEEDVDDWMIAGINAMLDKVYKGYAIPFDLPHLHLRQAALPSITRHSSPRR